MTMIDSNSVTLNSKLKLTKLNLILITWNSIYLSNKPRLSRTKLNMFEPYPYPPITIKKNHKILQIL